MMDLNAADSVRPSILGTSVDALTMTQAIWRCTQAIDGGGYLSIGVVNAAKIIAMRRDTSLRQAVTNCDMVLADGQSVVWASRVLRTPLPERVAGIDLFLGLLAEAERRGNCVYFLGARQHVLTRMLDQVQLQFPGLKVAGARDGYFSSEDEATVVAGIRESGAELLFLGMSSPKKELFVSKWGEATGVKVAHGVGGSFDVLGGLTRRAPLWYQEHGLEWFYRAKQEPLRLGRRYLKTNFAFILMVAHEAVASRTLFRTTPGPAIRAAAAATAARTEDASERTISTPGENP
jgi:N-acetylglucosaminyldiphosphoundecaprenol N-acetyl-beta-D-mannosaminyltransferase